MTEITIAAKSRGTHFVPMLHDAEAAATLKREYQRPVVSGAPFAKGGGKGGGGYAAEYAALAAGEDGLALDPTVRASVDGRSAAALAAARAGLAARAAHPSPADGSGAVTSDGSEAVTVGGGGGPRPGFGGRE